MTDGQARYGGPHREKRTMTKKISCGRIKEKPQEIFFPFQGKVRHYPPSWNGMPLSVIP